MSISLGSTSISNAYLGSSAASAIYLGGTLVWSATSGFTIGLDTIYLRGMGSHITQTQLANKLSGETITYFASQSGDVFASSSTDFGIANRGFVDNPYLTAYIDGGRGRYITSSGFQACTNLVSVTMPSASGMGTYAFVNCSNLVTASLPRMTQISDYAFRQTTALRILNVNSASITTIGTEAFAYSGIPTASFPNVTTIGYGAFDTTGLGYANFPSLTAIPQNGFKNSPYLQTINAPNATSIGQNAFYYSGLTTASFANVTTVGAQTFIGNPLQLVELPALTGPNALGGSPAYNYVFTNVSYTGSMTVPSEYLTNNNNGPDGDLAYLRTGLYNWTINYTPTTKIFIGGLASTLNQSQLAAKLTGETITYFNNTLIPNLYVSSSTNYSINADAFRENVDIISYVDGGKCTSIGATAFYLDTNLVTASFSSATSVGTYGFYGCTNLATLNLPKVTTLGSFAIVNTFALTTLDLPELVTAGEWAFVSSTSLQSVKAPKLISVPDYAFNACQALGIVDLRSATTLGTGAFFNCSTLYDLYSDGPLANVTTIGANAFQGCSNLTYINLSGLTGANAIGGSPLNNNVFSGVAVGGYITAPIYYQTNNAGGLDGDLAYLQNVQGWQIGWVGGTTTSTTTTTTTTAAPTVVIGTQEWMVSDLGVTKYANGDTIPQVTDTMEWATLTTGAWCYYANDPSKEKLYNLYAVNDPRGLAPAGYHLPTLADYNTLHNYLGGNTVAGGPLKETGTTHWQSPNTGATNTSGFTGLGTGYRSNGGDFLGNGTIGAWFGDGGYLTMYYDNTQSFATSIAGGVERYGFKVRLIKN